MSKRRPFQAPRSRLAAPRIPVSILLRALVLGGLVSAAAGWAVLRHYAEEPMPMRVPVPPSAPTYDIEAGEVPVPELLEPDAS